MISMLEASRLFDRTLPGAYAWVLDALFEIDQLKTGSSLGKAERRERTGVLYQKLREGLAALHEPTPAEHLHDAKAFRSWFCEAILLWIRFAGTGSAPLVDSVGAETLQKFPVDLPLDATQAQAVRGAAARAFGLSADELATLERRINGVTSNLDLKRAITGAIAADLAARSALTPEGRLALMKQFYGPLPFRPGDVDLLIVSTAIFFFVPRKGQALDTPGYAERPEAERNAVRAFFEKLDRANTAETRRFPSFGLYEPELMSSELVASLASTVGVGEAVVKATLGTMFSVIATSLHAQYLVHDLWGHTWQEALNEFEWEYALLPHLDRPLAPSDGPEFGGNGTPTLGSCFVARDGRTTLDEVRLVTFGEADLRGRIQVATSVPLSEVLADFMESKFSRSFPDRELPTSSLVPSTSLKVDLTISDTRTQVRRYTRPYRKLAVDSEEHGRLARELEASGLPRPGLAEAVERAGRVLFQSFAPAFDDTLAAEPAGIETKEVRSSVLRRLLLQFTLILVDFEKALGRIRPSTAEPWRDPASSPDLFAVAITHFYEQDRQKNFFFIDQIARNEFHAACEKISRELKV
jgi:hypothetical protein